MIRSVVVLALVITVLSAAAVFAEQTAVYGQNTFYIPSSAGQAYQPGYPTTYAAPVGRGPYNNVTPLYPSGSRTDLYTCSGYSFTPVDRGYVQPLCCPAYFPGY